MTNTQTLRPFRVTTTQREVIIQAESVEHAHALFTGKVWPPGVPPVPTPANERDPRPEYSHCTRPTEAWTRWYNDEFLPRRANYPVLAWAHGECILGVHEA